MSLNPRAAYSFVFRSNDSKMVVTLKRQLEWEPKNSISQSYSGSKRIKKKVRAGGGKKMV